MKKMTGFRRGKRIAAAMGAFWILAAAGAGTAFAAETETEKTSVAGGESIDARGAEELALLDAGVTEEMATRLKTKTEREKGETIYDVSFTVDGVEYEYSIREADGKILEWEIDGRDISGAAAEETLPETSESKDAESQDGETPIGLAKAKEIALLDAGLSDTDVRFSKIKYEDDKRKTVYEIEFYQERKEFEYEIDAYTGEILKMEWD